MLQQLLTPSRRAISKLKYADITEVEILDKVSAIPMDRWVKPFAKGVG